MINGKDLEIAIHQFAKRQMTWFGEWNAEELKYTGSTELPLEKR